MCAISRKQHCVILSTTVVEYMAMVERVKEGLFVRSALSLIQPEVVFPIELFEDDEAAITVVENPLRSSKSNHIDVRWDFIRDLVRTEAITVTHVKSG